jgi:hypothetical protein
VILKNHRSGFLLESRFCARVQAFSWRRAFAAIEFFATSEFRGKKFVVDIRNFATEPWGGGFEGSAGKGFRRKFFDF